MIYFAKDQAWAPIMLRELFENQVALVKWIKEPESFLWIHPGAVWLWENATMYGTAIAGGVTFFLLAQRCE